MIPHFDIDAFILFLDFLDSPAQDRNHTFIESLDLLCFQLITAGLRVDAGSEQDFIGVGIADGAEEALIHEKHPDLLTAALLHDVGKSDHPLRLWERVVIVLGKKLFPNHVQAWGRGKPKGWARPFVVASEHPLWGAELSRDVGVSSLAVDLIREHQNEIPTGDENALKNRLLALLQFADHQN